MISKQTQISNFERIYLTESLLGDIVLVEAVRGCTGAEAGNETGRSHSREEASGRAGLLLGAAQNGSSSELSKHL